MGKNKQIINHADGDECNYMHIDILNDYLDISECDIRQASHFSEVVSVSEPEFTEEQANFLAYKNGIPEKSEYWIKWEGNTPYVNWLNDEYKKYINTGGSKVVRQKAQK